MEMARHLLKIRKSAGYYFDLKDTNVNMEARNVENSGVSSNRIAVVSFAWDLDACRDLDVTTRTNLITSYRSTCFLMAYLWTNKDDPFDAHRARTQFHADLCRYFYPDPGVPNTAGIVSPWTLPTELGQKVIREFYINHLNHDPTFEKKPIIKVDIELTLFWAASRGDLNYPR